MSKLHNTTTTTENHSIHSWEVANATIRQNMVLVAADVGKVARQQDDGSLWIVAGWSPSDWRRLDQGFAVANPLDFYVNGVVVGSIGVTATNQISIGDITSVGNGANTITLGGDSITKTYLKGVLTSSVVDGVTAVAHALNSLSYTTVGSKLLSIRNNGVEKSYIDKDGAFNIGSTSVTINGLGTDGPMRSLTIVPANSGYPIQLNSNRTDGASSIAVKIDSVVGMFATGAKLLSIQNNGVEKASIDKDGSGSFYDVNASNTVNTGSVTATTASGIILISPVTGSSTVTAKNSVVDAGSLHYGYSSGSGYRDAALTLISGTGRVAMQYQINSSIGAKAMQLGQVFANGINLTASTNLLLGIDGDNTSTGIFDIVKGTWNGRAGSDGTSLMSITNAGVVNLGNLRSVSQWGGINLRSVAADGASAIGTVIDTQNNLVTSGAKLLSIRNNGVEKSFVNSAGDVYGNGGWVALTTNANASGGGLLLRQANNSVSHASIRLGLDGSVGDLMRLYVGNNNLSQITGNGTTTTRAMFVTNLGGYETHALSIVDLGIETSKITGRYAWSATVPLTTLNTSSVTILGTVVDGASAVSVITDSPAYTNATSKLLSIRNNGVEKAYVDFSGAGYFNNGLTVTGTTATDGPIYGAEFLTGAGWTSTGWTGSWAGGWTHTVGNTSVLSYPTAAVNATRYQIAWTVTAYSAGSFTLAFGGRSVGGQTASGNFGPTTVSTANLTITPTTDFDGTIVISIRAITVASTAILTLKDSSGAVQHEQRAQNAVNNTFLGVNAGGFLTTGAQNTAVGNNALWTVTSGGFNVGVGYGAGSSITTGGGNIGLGASSISSATIGSYNIGIGVYATQSVIESSHNIGIGYVALRLNSAGSQNIGIGSYALYNTTGSGNISMGTFALSNNTTGASNIGIGYHAGDYITDGVTLNTAATNSLYLGNGTRALADTQTNEIVIGHAAIGQGSNTVTLGNSSITKTYLKGVLTSLVADGASAVAHTLNSPAYTTEGAKLLSLQNNGVEKFYVHQHGDLGPTAIQGNAATDQPIQGEEFLTVAGWTSTGWTGSWNFGWVHTVGNVSVLSYPTAAVIDTPYDITWIVTGRTAGSFTLAFGGNSPEYHYERLNLSATGAWSTITISTEGLSITPTLDFNGTIRLFIRPKAAASPSVSLKDSSGILLTECRAWGESLFWGLRAGQYSSGNPNTAFGTEVLEENSTGTGNSAFGRRTLQKNIGGWDNSAFGNLALACNTGGNYNAAFGSEALFNNLVGSYNSAFGMYAGADSQNDNSVFIGFATEAAAPGGTNENVFGYAAIGNGSNTVTLGNASIVSTHLKGYIKLTPVLVTSLVAAATAGAGARAFVSDATATTFASIVVGSGSNNVPVYCDGTNWRIG